MGGFSPLDRFMSQPDFQSVLDTIRPPGGRSTCRRQGMVTWSAVSIRFRLSGALLEEFGVSTWAQALLSSDRWVNVAIQQPRARERIIENAQASEASYLPQKIGIAFQRKLSGGCESDRFYLSSSESPSSPFSSCPSLSPISVRNRSTSGAS